MTRSLLILAALMLTTPPVSAATLDRQPWLERRVHFLDLPGPVRETVLYQQDRDPITDITVIRYHGKTTWLVNIEDPDRNIRAIRIDRDGNVIDRYTLSPDNRKTVPFDTLPEPVRTTLLRQSDYYDRVVRITRDDETWYIAYARDDTVHRLDESGLILETDDPNR